jgi:hypothetical protein
MRRSAGAIFLASGLLTFGPSALTAGNLSTDVDGVLVELTSLPETPRTGQETTYSIRLFDRAGAPLTGVTVTLQGRMPDGMTVLAPLRPGSEPGIYHGRVLFTMEGRWELRLRVRGQGKPFELSLTEQVSR